MRNASTLDFMKHSFICIIVFSLCGLVTVSEAADAPAPAVFQNSDWNSLKYGLYIHFTLATFGKPGVEWFAPTDLNVKSWAHTAKEAGMTCAILKVKVLSGFCLWDSADYPNDVGGSPLKEDIIAEFITACEAEDIRPGILYSIPDGYNEGQVRRSGAVPPPYFHVIKKHIAELYSKYPGIKAQVFDALERLSSAQLDELRGIIKRSSPSCIILGDGNDNQGPAYDEATVITSWVWRPDARLNPTRQLYDQYTQSMKNRRCFMLNVAPDRTGRIPQPQVAVLMEMKKLIAEGAGSDQSPTPPGGKAVADERLKRVKELYEKGLINKEQYDAKVKEIMDSL
jgi:alpha-L-fucosidase